MNKKWYEKTGWIIALLILFFPAGLFLMWKYTNWNKTVKWVVTGIFAFFVLVSAVTPDSTTTNTASQNTEPTVTQETQPTTQPEPTAQPEQTQQTTATPANATTAPARATNTPAPQNNQAGETVSQKNAVRKAKSYISFSGFSRDGLVAQLEYEQFSRADAEYGADHSGANWNEEAAQKAKSYMDMMGYSRDGLIQQLLYEKFTQAQAEYGANSVGL
jgi:type IV secretory pathway VirB10-like protein